MGRILSPCYELTYEGFAEYSALMIIKELFGEEAFNRRIEAKKSILAEKPPIWGFDRNDRTTPEKSDAVEAILYSKGPILLHLLEQKIGRDDFHSLCKELYKSCLEWIYRNRKRIRSSLIA